MSSPQERIKEGYLQEYISQISIRVVKTMIDYFNTDTFFPFKMVRESMMRVVSL